MTSAYKTYSATSPVLPNISLPNVKAAVASLGRSQGGNQANSLEYLELIDEALFSPSKPFSPEQRRFELHGLLASTITTVLTDYRQTANLPLPEKSVTRLAAFEHIRLDILHGHPQIIGWSMLYYLFVRVDLNISREAFTQLGSYADRTFHRFQDLAEQQLTEILYHREAEIRLKRRRESMLARLPHCSETLFGRQTVIEHLMQLQSETLEGVIQVYGPEGVGKTSAVREAIRQQIEQDKIDQLVWISAPVTVEYLRQQVAVELPLPLTQLQAYTARYAVTLVIDNLDVCDLKGSELDAFLCSIASMKVLLLTRKRRMLSCVEAYIALSGLDFTATQQFLLELERRTFGVLDHALTLEEMEMLWVMTKGNPQHLKQEFVALFGPD